jgi:quinol monooxygenase YgiN
MIVLVVTYIAKEGQEARLEERLREMTRLTRREPGCIDYNAQRAVDNPRKYILYERYINQDALDAHSNADYFKRYVLGEYPELLESRTREVYEPVV